MAITVRVLDLGALAKFVTKADMRAVGERIIALQSERIAAGEGTHRKLKKLSKAYAKETGRPDRVRTLKRTGRMLASRAVVEVTESRTKVGFRNKAKYVYVQQAKTPFVKATKKERVLLRDFLADRVKARLAENLRSAKAGKR